MIPGRDFPAPVIFAMNAFTVVVFAAIPIFLTLRFLKGI
jgi:hypothetical protein